MKKSVFALSLVLVFLLAFAIVSVYQVWFNHSHLGTGSSSATSKILDPSVATEFVVLSPENKTYDTADVPLSVATNESATQFQYALDGQENVTVTGNMTLTDLLNGLHNITVYAYVYTGNTGNSKNIVFRIAIPNPTPAPQSQLTSAYGSFGPLGGFSVKSPSNRTYVSSLLTVEVSGQVIVGKNVQLYMTYSLDGQESHPFPVLIKQAHEWDPFIGVISGSLVLPELSEGSHSITIAGDLQTNSTPNTAQVTVYFTVN